MTFDWPPFDPAGFVFFPRAIDQVGRAMFGQDWAGDEPMAARPSPLPVTPSKASQSQREEVLKLLLSVRPDLRVQPLTERPRQKLFSRVESGRSFDSSGGVFEKPLIEFTAAEWQAALEVVAHRIEGVKPAMARFAAVMNEISMRCESGDLISAIRPRVGGAMQLIPRHLWNAASSCLDIRFRRFALDPKRPFINGLSNDAQWIFIEKESLNRACSHLGSSHASTIKDESDAIIYLTSQLMQNPDLKRADAEDECERFGISQRGFRDRVWPKAREKAGLSAIAPPGRKKQKNRNA